MLHQIKNKMKQIFIIAISLISSLICQSCKGSNEPIKRMPHEPANAVYYWKTVFSLSSGEQEFIRENHIKRIYVRFFDVIVEDTDLNGEEEIVPNATVKFQTNQIPVKEIIPTVYITLDALKAMKGKESHWAMTIARRIANMCSYNEIRQVGEVQLDCDYAARQQEAFYKLCYATGLKLHMQDIKLSVTVRLHNLRQEPPPADCGVLMVYNTASVRNPNTRNSIIDPADVNSFLRKKPCYALPLDVAYPTFSWSVIADSGRMKLSQRTNWNDTTLYLRTGDNTYTVKSRHFMDGTELSEGAEIRVERSDFASVMAAKRIVDNAFRQDTSRNVLLYHLDSLNLSKFTDNEIQDIYGSR